MRRSFAQTGIRHHYSTLINMHIRTSNTLWPNYECLPGTEYFFEKYHMDANGGAARAQIPSTLGSRSRSWVEDGTGILHLHGEKGAHLVLFENFHLFCLVKIKRV